MAIFVKLNLLICYSDVPKCVANTKTDKELLLQLVMTNVTLYQASFGHVKVSDTPFLALVKHFWAKIDAPVTEHYHIPENVNLRMGRRSGSQRKQFRRTFKAGRRSRSQLKQFPEVFRMTTQTIAESLKNEDFYDSDDANNCGGRA